MTNPTGLHELILKIAHGDKGACAEFDDQTRTPLIQYVTAHFGSSLSDDDVVEVVSQAILNMFLHAQGYRGGNGDPSAWAWAYQIARNQALKWIKTRGHEVHTRKPGGSDLDIDVDEEQLYRMANRYDPDREPLSVEQEAEYRIFRAKAIEILQKLSPREQLVLRLYYEKEMTLKEIADFIHVTPARVTQIMQNIRRTCLREMAKTT